MQLLIAVSIIVAASSMTMAAPENIPSKKDPASAAIMEFFIPLAGHAYAGDVTKGLKPNLVSAAGMLVTMHGVSQSVDNMFSARDERDEGEEALMWGLIMFVGGKVWAMRSAYKVAAAHNEQIKLKIESDTTGTTMLKLSVPLDRFKLYISPKDCMLNIVGKTCDILGEYTSRLSSKRIKKSIGF